MEKQGLIIGIDYTKEYCQASYYSYRHNQPESVASGTETMRYLIPTALTFDKSNEEWLIGQAAIDYAKKTGCNRFIYASSMSTYGDHPQNPFVSEESATIPKSFYAVGKLASENYMRIYSNSFGLNCIALRFFNVYGAGQNMDNLKQGMASIFLAMAIKEKHILVKGSKTRFRDFVHVSDVVDAVLAVMDKKVQGFDVFNVSTGVATTVEAVIDEILKNLPDKTIFVEYTTGTPGDQHGIYGDYSKIQRVLGWNPKYDFASGMKDMVNWAQKTMAVE